MLPQACKGLVGAGGIELGESLHASDQNISVPARVGMMISLDTRGPAINGCQLVEVSLKRVAGESFDVSDQVPIFCSESLDRS